MNISELARQLNTTAKELKDILPQYGFDIGQRAIKIDNKVAQQVMRQWPVIKAKLYKERQEKQQEELSTQAIPEIEQDIAIGDMITVGEFAAKIGLPVTSVISQLMQNGILATINERVDFETASIIAEDLGKKVVLDQTGKQKEEDKKTANLEEKLAQLKTKQAVPRPPVIVILGHVDHGKTTLLDSIRTTDVANSESGGITQHIGAYQITKKDQSITFIDTPGHEAFTAMRSRGAKIADIAILVVAADDSIMPQTKECIQMIESAKLPVIVAINKMDKESANIDKVKSDLSNYKLIPEDWGGNTLMIPVSALTKKGLDELLDAVLLVYDVNKEQIIADPKGEMVAVVIESHVDPAQGNVATLLVKSGTLKKNDPLVLDHVLYGKARVLKDHNGKEVKEALPSMPVRVIGFKYPPHVGDVIEVIRDKSSLKKAKTAQLRNVGQRTHTAVSKSKDTEKELKVLNVVLKTDTIGSMEAILNTFERIPQKVVRINVISKGLGHINESDIIRGQTANAFVAGFKVNTTSKAQELLQESNVIAPEQFAVKKYDVIYELFDDIKVKMQSLIEPDIIRESIGKLEILAVFNKSQGSYVCGGKVIDGHILSDKVRETKVEIQDEGAVIGKGKLLQLQSSRVNVNEVQKGQECGLKIETGTALQPGMVLEFYFEREERKTLEG